MKVDFIEHIKQTVSDKGSVDAAFEHFRNELGIDVKVGGNFALLDYSQIDSPKFHSFVDQCRGSVIHIPSMTVTRRMFDRFYNLGEFNNKPLEDSFDFETGRGESKEDGSIIGTWFNPEKYDEYMKNRHNTLFFAHNMFEVGTRGNPVGDQPLWSLTGNGDNKTTYRKLFEDTIRFNPEDYDIYSFMFDEYRDYTFIFELCTLENRVVKAYAESGVYLLGIRHNETGIEFTPAELDDIAVEMSTHGYGKIKRPTFKKFSSFEEVIEDSKHLKNLDEGYVLIDHNFNRIKVKSPVYVAVHHTKGNDGITPLKAINLIRINEIDEYRAYFPEYASIIDNMVEKYNLIKPSVMGAYEKFSHLESQKDYALAVKDLPYSAILFMMRKGMSYDVILANMKDEAIYNIIKAM